MGQRVPASEQTHQRLQEFLGQGVADGNDQTELIKLAVRKIVEEALEAEVSEVLGRGYYENGAAPGPVTAMGTAGAASRRPKAAASMESPRWLIGPIPSSRGSAPV